MAKQKAKTVVHTANKQPTIKDALLALALETTITEQVKEYRERIQHLQGGKYQEVFAVAQRASNKAAFDTAVESVKAQMKEGGRNIDRTYSNAVSATRRYWKLCIEHDGKTVVVDRQGNKVKVSKSIKGVKTFNMLKVVAEAAKKMAEKDATQGGALPEAIADKLALLRTKLEHTHPEQAKAALDAALAHFLVGGEARHGGAHGEPVSKRKQDSTKATSTAASNRKARTPAREVTTQAASA